MFYGNLSDYTDATWTQHLLYLVQASRWSGSACSNKRPSPQSEKKPKHYRGIFYDIGLIGMTSYRDDNYCAPLAFSDAGGGEWMFETGAVPSQDGAGRSPDGEGLAAAPHEDSQSEHQLNPAGRLRNPTCRLHLASAGFFRIGPTINKRGLGGFLTTAALFQCLFGKWAALWLKLQNNSLMKQCTDCENTFLHAPFPPRQPVESFWVRKGITWDVVWFFCVCMISYTWSCLHSILPTILLNPSQKNEKINSLRWIFLCRTGGIANVALRGMSKKGKNNNIFFTALKMK